jgi:hypothetical protein
MDERVRGGQQTFDVTFEELNDLSSLDLVVEPLIIEG